jgi:transcriptional regulator with XRE-family HTH domain
MAIATAPNPLGERLRSARGRMLSKDLAHAARWPASKVSKIESGRQLPTPDDLETWARIVDAEAGTLEQWRSMLEQVQADRHRFAADMAAGQAALQEQYENVIARTTLFRFYEKVFVPRFLQTPAYTRGIMTWATRIYRPEVDLSSPEAQRDIDQAVALRQSSTQLLFDLDRKFEFVYGDLVTIETTLGDEPKVRADEVDTYRAQMDRLWEVAAEGDLAFQLIEDARAAIPH